MQVFPNLEEAQAQERQRDTPYVEIRRISDTEWHAYETAAEVPPEPQT